MKSGKFLFLAIIFLVSLVCISAVSAADEAVSEVIADTNDDVSNENLALEESDENVLGDEPGSEIGPPLMVGSFSTLNDDINNGSDEVDLEYDYNYEPYIEEDHDFQDGITIIHDVTINGNGRTISGSSQARIFYIPTGISVVLKNINFIDGYTTDDGGAIFVNGGNCTLINCNFTNNYAAYNGGAIYTYDGQCTAQNCNFNNNNASNNGGAIYDGDAVNCNFTGNFAANWGGAIADGDATGCTFKNNHAGVWSGALDEGDATNCVFINNSANFSGALYGSAVNCTFINNRANAIAGAMSEGNAIGCTFTGNSAGEYGGAIFEANAIGCTFTGNSATDGGAICNGSATNCVFTNNSAKNIGGAMCNGSAKDCKFIGNTAKNGGSQVAGCNVTGNTSFVYATKITAKAVSTTYNVKKYLVITLKDSDGKALSGVKVTVKLGKTKTYKTNSKGQIKINVANLVPKTYTAKISLAGNDKYIKSSASAKVTVKKATPKLTAKAKTFKVKVKTKKYTVTLKNNVKKVMKKTKLTLKVGKKTYKATTNSKGKATFKITKLTKKGKYTATIKFAGNKYYKKLTKKVKITVK